MNKITVNIEITSSKILAYLIMTLSFILSYHLKEPTSLAAGILAATAIVTNKQYQDRVKQSTQQQTDNKPIGTTGISPV